MALPLTTDQPDRTVAPAERTLARKFVIERLGSFLAFFPLGVWTVVHLWSQLAAFSGARVWEQSVTAHASPATGALTMTLVIGALLWLAWIHPRFVEGRPEPFSDISHEMHHHTPTLIVYVLGILAIAYHLANGVWSFSTMGWGLAVSKRAQAWLERVAGVVFLALLAVGWASIYALYKAGA